MSLSRSFTKAEVAKISQLRMPTGEFLSWGHVLPLLTEESPKRRQKYLDRLKREDISTRDFQELIQLDEGHTEAQSAGRKRYMLIKDRAKNDGRLILLRVKKLSESWLQFHNVAIDPKALEPVPLGVPKETNARQELVKQVGNLIEILERQQAAVNSLVYRLKFSTLPRISQDSQEPQVTGSDKTPRRPSTAVATPSQVVRSRRKRSSALAGKSPVK